MRRSIARRTALRLTTEAGKYQFGSLPVSRSKKGMARLASSLSL